ncbi:MAG: pyridoxal phosphate-dependent aminotransferase [Nitrospinales bacterium]
MKFSKRIQSIKPSLTLEIDATARALKAQGEDVISFGAGEPDFSTPDPIKKAAIQAINNGETHYTPVGGTVALKDAIVAKLKNDNGLSYEPKQIVASCGAKHSLYNLAQVLWDEGDEIIIPAPYWVSYPEMVVLANATPVILHTTGESGFKITPEQFQSAITPQTRALILNSPSNPTGSAYEKNELEAIAEVALKNNILIITDEIYEKIIFDDFEFTSIASLGNDVKKNCVIVNGVSKSYAMTGWRIGYIAAEPEIAAAAAKLQSQITSGPASISQAASVEALTGSQDDVLYMVGEFKKRRDYLMERYAQIPGVTCLKPPGTFYSFPDFSGVYDKTWNGEPIGGSLRLAQYLLEEAKVAIVPGLAFGADNNARLSFATSMDNLTRGLDRIAEAVNSLK